MPDIVITEFMDEDAVASLSARFDTHYDPALVDDPEAMAALLGEARALIVRNRTQVRGAVLEAAPRLSCVGRLGVGLDNIDTGACSARGVTVYPATGANDASVAEYVVTAALVLLRGAWHATGRVAAGEWPRQELMGCEVGGKTLGLVGFGGAWSRITSGRIDRATGSPARRDGAGPAPLSNEPTGVRTRNRPPVPSSTRPSRKKGSPCY